MKKLVSIVLALCMLMMVGVVFAEGNPEPGEFTNPQGTFTGGKDGTGPETTISASGLKAGDSVEVYQLVEWEDVSKGWKLSANCGVTLDELLNGITEAEATTIAGNISNYTKITTLTANGEGKVSYNCANKPGLFYLKAIPSADNKDTVYNPAFVSADYYDGNNVVDFGWAIGSSAVLKKSSVPFDKEVTGNDQFVDVKPGDVIPYKITTTIPSYGTTFTNPKFIITDTLSSGLTLEGDITVKYGETTTTTSIDKVVTITKDTPTNGFTVDFAAEYLTGLAGATPEVEISYSAKVSLTPENLENVEYMDNKAKLTFSNTPTTTKDQDDITRHYTFSIDANLNGGNHGNERSRELIKIGVDEAGNVITDFTSWVDGKDWTEFTPLEGAKFSLTGNGITRTAESTAEGYVSFYGLDAGTYTLTETEAPAGYIRDTSEHTVVITPTYTGENNDILEGYTVTIDGENGAVSTYTITNMSDANATVETIVDNSSETWPFVNTKGAELPSTGGIGTTIFYILGGLLVIGAAVILVARRKAND